MTIGQHAWHDGGMDTTSLTAAQAATARWKEAKDALDAAKEQRDDAIRQADKSGCAQTEIVKATGLTRETIRRITNPEAAEAVRRAQRTAKPGRPVGSEETSG
jgi:DNA invertase Pin-like site-specific DNA recombinase